MTEEVLPLCTQLLRDGGFMTHAHFVHDLEVVLILVPRPLQVNIHIRTLVISLRFNFYFLIVV